MLAYAHARAEFDVRSMLFRLQQKFGHWPAYLDAPAGLPAVCLAIFAIGLGARLALLGLLGYQPRVEFAEIEKLAVNLAESGTLGNPYYLPTGPSAHHAPVYPMLLAGIFRLWGYGASGAWAMCLMDLSFASLQYAMLPLLARSARLAVLPAALAALVGAAVPFRVLTEARWGTTLVAVATIVAVMVSIRWSRDGLPSYARSIAAGGAWGLCLLTAPALLPMFLLLVVWWALSPPDGHRRTWLPRLAVLMLASAVVLTPWTIRNYQALGGVVFVRSNFGIEFSVSNHDAAHAQARDNYLIGYPNNYFHENHPWSSRAHAQRVQRLGERAYNRERLAEAIAWCRDQPGQFLTLTARRFWLFWAMPSINQRYKDVLLQPITVLGLVGLVILWRRDRQVGAVFGSLFIGYPLVYYVVQTGSRYRYAIEWALLLLAAYTLAAVAARVHAGLQRTAAGTTTRRRLRRRLPA